MALKKIVLFGTAQMAEQLKILVEKETDAMIAGFVVDDAFYENSEFCGLQVVPFSKLSEKFPADEYSVMIAIGMRNMNDSRKRIYLSLKEMGYVVESFVSSKASIYTEDIGEGNIFLPNCVIAPKVVIGNANFFDVNTAICHHTKVGNYNFFAVAASTAGDVTVGDSCFIASNAIIRNSVVVADQTLVGAGAYLDKDTIQESVFVPARGSFLENVNKNTNKQMSAGGGR